MLRQVRVQEGLGAAMLPDSVKSRPESKCDEVVCAHALKASMQRQRRGQQRSQPLLCAVVVDCHRYRRREGRRRECGRRIDPDRFAATEEKSLGQPTITTMVCDSRAGKRDCALPSRVGRRGVGGEAHSPRGRWFDRSAVQRDIRSAMTRRSGNRGQAAPDGIMSDTLADFECFATLASASER